MGIMYNIRDTSYVIPYTRNMFKKIAWGTFLSLAGVYVVINFVFSQLISPLYFRQVVDERDTIVSYLQSVRSLPTFQKDLILYKNLYGKRIEEEVFYNDTLRENKILELEETLQKNPSSRDTLYNLYLLYSQAGNETKAIEYLNKAKQIDPAL